MKKTTALQRILIIALIILIVLTAIFITLKYAWRLFGFKYCDSTTIEDIKVTDTYVEISGVQSVLMFPDGFIGYTHKLEGDTLYVGFYYNNIVGFFEDAHFTVKIETDTPVKKVVTVYNGDMETVIWPNLAQ